MLSEVISMHQETDRVKTVHSYDPWVESVGVLLRRGGSRRTSKRGGQGVEADTPDSPAPFFTSTSMIGLSRQVSSSALREGEPKVASSSSNFSFD
ncbi:UNVERIFIED_CONTAM: hypothetical protein Sradi_3764800 [Sesamum radiatum]|uniref:Uncharacterized protein n=1 Tax=Sesamum radiatum TaxID=300843 RepID=A0AAW2PZC4_SESRA